MSNTVTLQVPEEQNMYRISTQDIDIGVGVAIPGRNGKRRNWIITGFSSDGQFVCLKTMVVNGKPSPSHAKCTRTTCSRSYLEQYEKWRIIPQ
jgi:hypothetical protein